MLKKAAATLEELVTREDEIKESIKNLQKQQKQIAATRKQFQKLQASMPVEKPHRRVKKPATSAAA